MGCETLTKVWNALFPTPRWVREFEAALQADTSARQRLYEYWDSVLRSAVR